jgi:Flp pilus assembly protein TadG
MLLHPHRKNTRGQVIVMVTLALLAMFAIMGLAVDLGWSFFVRKQAQAAADSAALAAIHAAFAGTIDCAHAACTAPVACPGATLNLANGCLYAKQNGFETDGKNRSVTLEANLGSIQKPAHVSYLTPDYWVTARVQQTIPQLFSAVLGKKTSTGTSGARATAAIVHITIPGALVLLNRENDCLPMGESANTLCGVNIFAKGGSWVHADGGITMASTSHGEVDSTYYAGSLKNGATVQAASGTMIRANGAWNGEGAWTPAPQNGFPDSDLFTDPMRNLNGQPPSPPKTDNNIAVTDCTIAGGADADHTLKLSPGKYYAVAGKGNCKDGDPIAIAGFVEFTGGADGFGNYTFFGGIVTQTTTNITFGPGRYVFAGSRPTNNGPGALFDASSGQVTLTDYTPLVWQVDKWVSQPNKDAGELFVFTGPDAAGVWYPGLDTSNIPSSVLQSLQFGTSGFKTGANKQVNINLHGLNETGPHLPDDLKSYFKPDPTDISQPVLIWQDQRNSVVKYYSSGTKLMDCITDYATGCTNVLANKASPELDVAATAAVHLYGAIYQPRGSWTFLSGSESYSGPLRIITGAIRLNGNADLDLITLGTPMTVRSIAMIE